LTKEKPVVLKWKGFSNDLFIDVWHRLTQTNIEELIVLIAIEIRIATIDPMKNYYLEAIDCFWPVTLAGHQAKKTV
jgi:hypothetical protein